MIAKLVQKYNFVVELLTGLKDIPLLMMRLVLAYGFYTTAAVKWSNIEGVSEWFGSLGIPAPLLNTYLAASAEAAGVVLLTLGFATRIISIPLIITMVVAIVTVHLHNGFEAAENGFEIPLYYFIMLLTLVINGAGKISADNFIQKYLSRN
ncbi:MAG: DoxX family protein [Ignavibacteriae bacterium HGW-Ignavibacteriae-3]|nr:MAG: DoxX family protein [Ignavibacteriae bacterium HGW-Ignavibacteriae-3]